MIFLVLSGAALPENLKEIRAYKKHIGGAELRADFLADPGGEDWPGFFQALGELPLILTLRKPEDGGRFCESEDRRRELFLSLLEKGNFRYIDLEGGVDFPDVEEAARAKGVRIIRSFHDFTGVPEDLTGRVRSLVRKPGDIPKAAVMPKSCRDFARLIDAFRDLQDVTKILLGMGQFGFAARVLAPRLGSWLTFASPAGDALAPGLIDPRTLDTVYRYHSQSPATRVFGIIGSPILHSKSPHIHNPGYTKLGIDGVYVPFHVDRVEDFLPVVRKLNIEGFSVTVPFKEEIPGFCAHTEDAVRGTGACNTVKPREDGLYGYNTDVEGFLAPLRAAFPAGLSGLRAAVIGAGGAARSAVYALAREGARVLVVNRTAHRARRLCGDIQKALGLCEERVRWVRPGEQGLALIEEYAQLIVNSTTMGMSPWEDLDPLAARAFRGTETVYDMVYSPRETLFLKRALAAGCAVIYGEQMLMSQAYRQFYVYTGKELDPSAAYDL
ncbi:MAG: shikimate dehydrogenase [Spirochaetales bacterium]|jgi:3-dehydroquinate dehydratase/shikimate dehydrogenase|nr:shikimate dehydrogenase [Spirochaetales bacterium]